MLGHPKDILYTSRGIFFLAFGAPNLQELDVVKKTHKEM